MSNARHVVSPPALVLGGGIAGLAAARLLSRHYPEVLVLERDVRSDAVDVEEAFRSWQRGGVPQFRHSHAFLARVRMTLLAHMPEVLERLRLAGVREIALADSVPPGMTLPPRPDDEDVVLLACRRSTFEWALRESVRTRPGIELREGVHVAGFTSTRGPGERPWVSGVRLDDGTELAASIVVDALGRRSPAPAWLAAIGAPAARERSHETGIFYYTRFYRVRRHLAPQGTTGLVAGDLGWVKIAVFPGDHDTFSITVGPPVDDRSLKRLSEPEQFERFVSAFPQIAPWRAPGVSDPIHGPETPVLVMGQLRNRMRHFVDDAGPVAPGLFVIGDAAYHTNPIYGRGCPTALAQASLLDEAIGRHRADPIAAARYLHQASERELRPYWDAAVASDRRMLGGDATIDLTNPRALLATLAAQAVGWFLDRGVLPATRADPVVFRGLLRVFHMLDAPERLMADPTIVVRSLPVLARVLGGMGPRHAFEPVRREEALARLAG